MLRLKNSFFRAILQGYGIVLFFGYASIEQAVAMAAESSPVRSKLSDTTAIPAKIDIPSQLSQAAPSSPSDLISISSVTVIGSTLFSQESLAPLVTPLEGNSVTLNDLQQVAERITVLYQEQGYLTSQAIVPEQTLTDGIVEIQIIEGYLGDIDIQGLKKIKPDYVLSRLNLADMEPLNVVELDNQLRLLRLNSLFDRIESTLEAGENVGESILTITVDEAPNFYGEVSVDNYSPPSVGSERYGAMLGYRNLTGLGDDLSVDFKRSFTGGSNLWDIAYQIPVSPRDGSIRLRTAFSDTKLTESPFDAFDIEGENERYEITWREPLIRKPHEEFALSLGLSYQDGRTFAFDRPTAISIGAEEDGTTRTAIVRFGQDYLKWDSQGAWNFRSLFNIGTGLFDATTNDGDIPDGQFFSWLGQVQRLQRLSDDHLLIIRGGLQLASDSLLTSEQFVIGGGESLRGYRQNIRTGDNGFRLSVEDRITLDRNQEQQSTLQLIPFFEMGTVWNNNDNPNPQPSQRFLASIGTGLAWQPTDGLNLRLDYGLPLVDLDDRGDNIQDDGFYFSASYSF
ncbi:MAG: ShlB/FhaC/HecB family hemolysin secretion/activation protein [Cyanobacteria bacterium P01_H01_bin.105]